MIEVHLPKWATEGWIDIYLIDFACRTREHIASIWGNASVRVSLLSDDKWMIDATEERTDQAIILRTKACILADTIVKGD